MPEYDRPRERLLKFGSSNLTDDELLSIILKTGTKKCSVKELSSLIISKLGSISKLKDISYHELIKYEGIGPVKACELLALAELSKRINSDVLDISKVKYTTPKLIYDYFRNKINLNQEEFHCIYLAANSTIIKEKMLFLGTVNRSMVHPRDIFKEAFEVNASSIICIHNHPSGDVRPSREDEEVTLRMRQISVLMGIKFLDHIIIGKNNYYSFLENGKI